MQLLTFLQFLVLCAIELAIIQHYSAKDVGWNVQLVVFATWTMSIGMILLLPIDIYITNTANNQGIDPQLDPLYSVLEFWYIFLFYLVFLLTWTVIPVQQSYHQSGDIEPQNKLKRAIRLNLYFYLAISIIGIIFLVIIIKMNYQGDYNLMTFLKALANAWGITLVMLLLGYSVVTIPRSQWRTSNMEMQLNYLYFKAADIKEGQSQSFQRLEEVIVNVLELQQEARDFENSDILMYCESSLEQVPPEIKNQARETYQAQQRFELLGKGQVPPTTYNKIQKSHEEKKDNESSSNQNQYNLSQKSNQNRKNQIQEGGGQTGGSPYGNNNKNNNKKEKNDTSRSNSSDSNKNKQHDVYDEQDEEDNSKMQKKYHFESQQNKAQENTQSQKDKNKLNRSPPSARESGDQDAAHSRRSNIRQFSRYGNTVDGTDNINPIITNQSAGEKFINFIRQDQKPSGPPKHDLEYAINLRYNVKYYLAETKRARWEWKAHAKSVFKMEDIIASMNNKDMIITSDLYPRKPNTCLKMYIANLQWYWYTQVKNRIKYFLAAILAGLSWLIVYQETVLFLKPEMSILRELVLMNQSLIGIQIMTLIPLGFIIYGVHYGLFRIKISGFYGLYPDHHSDASSLLFTTINFSRVSAPLCFNFLNILQLKNCALNSALGVVDLMPVLGGSINKLLPSILILIAAFIYFDVWDRVCALFGLGNFMFASKYDKTLIDEGKSLMKQQREKEIWKKGGVNVELTYQRDRFSRLLSVLEGYEPN